MLRPAPTSTLFPYTTLFRSLHLPALRAAARAQIPEGRDQRLQHRVVDGETGARAGERRRGLATDQLRSEEHTSELQSHVKLVCRLLLEKKNEAQAGAERSRC